MPRHVKPSRRRKGADSSLHRVGCATPEVAEPWHATATLPACEPQTRPMAAGEKTPHGGALAADLVPEHLLDGGEIILFAIKPSLWLVLFSSLRWLLFFGVVALLAHRIAPLFAFASGTLIIKAAVALAAARVGFAVLEWSSRLYVLTNRRVLRIKGIFHIDLFECSLLKIEARLVQTWYERLFGLGSILIVAGETGRVHASWLHVARPAEVHEQLRAAIRRARGAGGGD